MQPSPWSQIPPEIAHEIAGHNSKDVPALRAMSLVSKEMRFLAIEHLFSIIHFACAEDFPRWLDMLRSTPSLTAFVKIVKFSEPGSNWLKRHRGPETSNLDNNALPHHIPPLPNVSAVQLVSLESISLQTAAAYIKLLPNVEKLHLEEVIFDGLNSFANFLGNFGNLKALSFVKMYVQSGYGLGGDDLDDVGPSGRPRESSTGGLTLVNVDELAITSCEPYESDDSDLDPILYLLQHLSPTGLKSLDFGGFGYNNGETDSCSISAMKKIFRIGASSLLNLTIEPTFLESSANSQFVKMIGRLPVFSALRTLTIWLGSNRQAQQLLKTLKAVPNLTTIIFRIRLYGEDGDEPDRKHVEKVLNAFLPWTGSASLRNALKYKFPLVQHVGFHFSVPHSSDLHVRREYRRKMEKQLWGQLEGKGDAVKDYLPVEWLDVEAGHTPVVYNQVNGKALWTIYHDRSPWNPREPDTETSDCESEKSDSGWDSDSKHPRTWTAADERSYQAELRYEAYDSAGRADYESEY